MMNALTSSLVALTLLCAGVSAQTTRTGFLSKRTVDTTNAVVIFPASTGKQIVLKSFDVTGDTNVAELLIGYGSTYTRTTGATAATGATNLTVGSSASFTVGDMMVVQRSDGTCTLHFVSSKETGILSIAEGTDLGTAAAANDYVFLVNSVFTNAVGAATVRKADNAILTTTTRSPLVLRLYEPASEIESPMKYINEATVQYVSP